MTSFVKRGQTFILHESAEGCTSRMLNIWSVNLLRISLKMRRFNITDQVSIMIMHSTKRNELKLFSKFNLTFDSRNKSRVLARNSSTICSLMEFESRQNDLRVVITCNKHHIIVLLGVLKNIIRLLVRILDFKSRKTVSKPRLINADRLKTY